MALWNAARPPILATFRMTARLNIALRRRSYRYIFVLGHVRSGSSLLAHLLANHPDFAGAGETHLVYRNPTDLQNLVLKTCELLHRVQLNETYVVDQINHDYVSDDVLQSGQLYKCIILLREPEATLKSMVSLSIWQEKQALDIYIKRLEELVHYASLLKERAFLVEYDDIVNRAEPTLAALSKFFGLNSQLTANYTTHRMTGRVMGYGDPSENIKAGRIIRTPKHDVTIGESTLDAAKHAFHKCREQLRIAITQASSQTMSPDDGRSSPTLHQ